MLQIWTFDIEPNVVNYCNNFLGKKKNNSAIQKVQQLTPKFENFTNSDSLLYV